MEAFPRNLQLVFPNVKYLTIQGCGLQNVSREDLNGLENLEYLNLWFNNLTSLPDDLFAGMEKLERIDFYKNKIERFSSKLLEPIRSKLKFADFTGNVKVNDFFNVDDKNKNDLTKLIKLIDSNCLQLNKQNGSPELIGNHISAEKPQLQKLFDSQATSSIPTARVNAFDQHFAVKENIPAEPHSIERQTNGGCERVCETSEPPKISNENVSQSLIQYFKTGDINSDVNIMELFKVASKLRKTCADRVLSTLNETNALEVFNLGHDHKSDELTKAAFNILQKMCPDIPDALINSPEHINKRIQLKQEFDALLAAEKSIQR